MMDGIRRARRLDLDCLASLERRSFPDPWTERAIAPFLDDPRALVLVAVQSGAVVGYVSFARGVDEAELLRLAVSPGERRRGLARRLCETGHRELQDLAVRRVFLEVRPGNRRARSLYSSLGFVELHRRRAYYPDGDDALVLGLELAPQRTGGGTRGLSDGASPAAAERHGGAPSEDRGHP